MTLGYLFLTDDQKRQLNDIYGSIVKKYKSLSTQSATLDAPHLAPEDAEALAAAELGARHAKILTDYDERVADINANASARGMSNSTLVLQQLEKAFARKQDALARLEDLQGKLAKRILADNRKLALAVEKEKSISRSRSLRDYVAVSKMKLTVPYNAQVQTLIDEELYSAYFAWLTQYPAETAYRYCNDNALFYLNMGNTKWLELLNNLDLRKEAN